MTTERKLLKKRLDTVDEYLAQAYDELIYIKSRLDQSSDPKYSEMCQTLINILLELGRGLNALKEMI